MKRLILTVSMLFLLSGCTNETNKQEEEIIEDTNTYSEITFNEPEISTTGIDVTFTQTEGDYGITLVRFESDNQIYDTEVIGNRIFVDALYSNTDYVLKVFVGAENGTSEPRVFELPFKTKTKKTPFIGFIGIKAYDDYITFSRSVTDPDNTSELVEVNLYKGNLLVDTIYDDAGFYNLEGVTEYTLEMVYTVDYNDGSDVQTKTVSKTVRTTNTLIDFFAEVLVGSTSPDDPDFMFKWTQPMKLYYFGKPSEENLQELLKVIEEINTLATDGFYIELVDTEEESNAVFYFGHGEDFAQMYDFDESLMEVYYSFTYYGLDWIEGICSSIMYMDIHRADINQQRNLIRLNMSLAIGLFNETRIYGDSSRHVNARYVYDYSYEDELLIKALYSPGVEPFWTIDDIYQYFPGIVEQLEQEE